MQTRKIAGYELSRLALGTKRWPMQDASRVDRLDREIAGDMLEAARAAEMNLVVSSYSDIKGEAEDFLGGAAQAEGGAGGGEDGSAPFHVATSFFELVDPRFSYVFQKQLKKLRTQRIDLYFVEGVCDGTRMRDIDSGAVDFLFEQKEAGKIGALGFSSELSPDNLADHLARYPWDFVRMKVNYHDWFGGKARACCQAAAEAGVPVLAHGALRTPASSTLSPAALDVLREADPDRSSIAWALLFVKSIDAVAALSCNMRSTRELAENAALFDDDAVLDADGLSVLEAAASAQKSRRRA